MLCCAAPHAADCHGKLDLSNIAGLEAMKTGPQPPSQSGAFRIKIHGKAVDWDIDAGNEAARDEWIEAIERARKPPVIVIASMTAGDGEAAGPVVAATPIVATPVAQTV